MKPYHGEFETQAMLAYAGRVSRVLNGTGRRLACPFSIMHQRRIGMGSLQLGFAGSLLLYGLSFGSGFWLSISGRPLSQVKLAAHKLTALGSFGLVVYTVSQSIPPAGFSTAQSLAIALTVLLFAGAIVTGGLLTMEKPLPGIVKSLHQRLPLVMALGMCGTLPLLVAPG